MPGVGVEPSGALETRKLFITRSETTEKNGRNAEPRYMAGTRSLAALAFAGGGLSCLLLVLLLVLSLFASFALAQERRTFTVPFDLHGGLILLKGELNGKPATFLLDTGANNSIVDAHSAGFNLKLDKLRSTGAVGAEGDCVVREVKLSLEHRSWLNRRVCVMDLSDASKRMGLHLDGFIGMDVLSDFRQVRINFETRTLELEK